LSAIGKARDFVRCAFALGSDFPAKGAILWRETRNLRIRIGLGRYRPNEIFNLRTTYGTLHFRDNFGDITNLTNLLCREVYRLPRAAGEGVVLDVGANIGLAAVWFDVRYPGRAIHCFEPLWENIQLVSLNARSARLNPVAVGAALGTTTLAVDRDGVMASSIPYARAAEQREVRVIALDDYVREEGIAKIAVLKIDVEGMELDVLSGAQLALTQTDQIAMETHGETRHKDVLQRLTGAGFTIERESYSGPTGLVFAARPLVPRPATARRQ
jgi:FkbM family methyltransferase